MVLRRYANELVRYYSVLKEAELQKETVRENGSSKEGITPEKLTQEVALEIKDLQMGIIKVFCRYFDQESILKEYIDCGADKLGFVDFVVNNVNKIQSEVKQINNKGYITLENTPLLEASKSVFPLTWGVLNNMINYEKVKSLDGLTSTERFDVIKW